MGKLQGPDVLKLSMAVDKLNIHTLTRYIQDYLIENRDNFIQQNPIEMLNMVYQHETFGDLWDHSLEKICEKPEILFGTDKFFSLKAPLLESLLKRNDLLLDEIVIWDELIKWCFAQNSNILQDPMQWNKEETVIVERTIYRFVPFLKFYFISSEDFITKVYPFKEIIPKELTNNVLLFHMGPNRQINVGHSSLVNYQYFAMFSSWIEKKNDFHYDARNIPYNFNLLYLSSRDGNTEKEFHEKCDKKGATIVIVKIADSEKIVGGYNPLPWNSSNSRYHTRDSFIFSFTNKNIPRSAKVGYSGGQNAISCRVTHGPSFGDDIRDLNFYKGWWYCNDNPSYPNIDVPVPTKFKADYEVFQVVKK